MGSESHSAWRAAAELPDNEEEYEDPFAAARAVAINRVSERLEEIEANDLETCISDAYSHFDEGSEDDDLPPEVGEAFEEGSEAAHADAWPRVSRADLREMRERYEGKMRDAGSDCWAPGAREAHLLSLCQEIVADLKRWEE